MIPDRFTVVRVSDLRTVLPYYHLVGTEYLKRQSDETNEAKERLWQAAMEPLQRPDWDTYFLDIARAVGARADCTRRQVGAVIVDTQHRIISTGYNGAAAGAPGCLTAGACPRGQMSLEEHPSYAQGNQDFSNCIAVHAEANALLYADGRHTRGATLYSTDKPCSGCERLIEGAGITRVVHP